MNGNCYFSEGLNPAVTCNKNEGNRIAIPFDLHSGQLNSSCSKKRKPSNKDHQKINNSPPQFIIDKGYKFEERQYANCITAREDRGLSNRRQEGTLVCIQIEKENR